MQNARCVDTIKPLHKSQRSSKDLHFHNCIFNFHRRVAQLCFICSANLIAGRITIWFAAVQRLSCNVTAQSIKIGQFSAMSIVSIHSERAGAACVHRHKGGNTDTKARITRANLQWCHAWYNIVWASYARIYPGLRQGWGAAAKEIPLGNIIRSNSAARREVPAK